MGSRRPVVQVDGTTSVQASSLGGSVALGVKLNRVLFGVGFELDSFGASTEVTSPAGTSRVSARTTSYLIAPALQLSFLRVAAGRLELLLSAQLGLGQALTRSEHDPTLPPTVRSEIVSQTFHINYQLGPGLRLFVMPRLALTLLAGVTGDHFSAAQDAPSGVRSDWLSSFSVFGHLGVLAVF